MLNVSKWIKIPLLLEVEEMEDLFHSISFHLYRVGCVIPKGEGVISPEAFVALYRTYIETLKGGEVPPSSPFFTTVLSVTEEALETLEVDEHRELLKPKLPVVQMQGHAVRYSAEDGEFRSQLYGSDGISWGIQLGYPQIYEEPTTHAIIQTRELPNGPLFHAIQKWVRQHTRATPFIVEGQRKNVPIRLGKKCFEWIEVHPQLKERGISVDRG